MRKIVGALLLCAAGAAAAQSYPTKTVPTGKNC